jgi:hypothetical protein
VIAAGPPRGRALHAHHGATTGSEQQGFETTRAAVSQLHNSAGGVHPCDRIDYDLGVGVPREL